MVMEARRDKLLIVAILAPAAANLFTTIPTQTLPTQNSRPYTKQQCYTHGQILPIITMKKQNL